MKIFWIDYLIIRVKKRIYGERKRAYKNEQQDFTFKCIQNAILYEDRCEIQAKNDKVAILLSVIARPFLKGI